jgi:hypothetical protein
LTCDAESRPAREDRQNHGVDRQDDDPFRAHRKCRRESSQSHGESDEAACNQNTTPSKTYNAQVDMAAWAYFLTL